MEPVPEGMPWLSRLKHKQIVVCFTMFTITSTLFTHFIEYLIGYINIRAVPLGTNSETELVSVW